MLRLVRQGGKARRNGEGRPGAPNLVAFPLSHLAGMFNTLLALYNDREILLMRRFEVGPFLDLVERHRVPSVILNPTMVYMLCDAPGSAEAVLASLRFVRSGSSRLRRSWAPGSTSASGCPSSTATARPRRPARSSAGPYPICPGRPRSSGRWAGPTPVSSLRFVDEQLADVAGRGGRGALREGAVHHGRVPRRRDRRADFVDGGFLRTGDLGRIDGDGFVWLVGRRKEIISCGGFKILPEEVEEALRSHPAVADVMVAGVPDDRLGETPCAFVVPRPDARLAEGPAALAAALADHARARLARYKLPRDIRFVEALPRNATGKVMRARAEELLAGSDAAPVRDRRSDAMTAGPIPAGRLELAGAGGIRLAGYAPGVIPGPRRSCSSPGAGRPATPGRRRPVPGAAGFGRERRPAGSR